MSLVLHDYELDADAYKVRLLLALLGVPHEKVPVNVHPGREHLSPAYRRLNPLGTLPILVDGDLVLHGAEAILAYLARRFDTERRWLPEAPAAFGRVLMWLGFAGRELAPATAARLHHMLEAPGDPVALDHAARSAFRILEDEMTRRELAGEKWFVGETATLADLALFPAIALSRDFGIDHDEYPALRRWMRRVRTLPGFVTMPGIPDYH